MSARLPRQRCGKPWWTGATVQPVRLLRRVLAAMAGCGVVGSLACCGGMPLRETTVQLIDSSITTTGDAVRSGDMLLAKATTIGATATTRPRLMIELFPANKRVWIYLYDDATHGDASANDGCWTNNYTWPQDFADSLKAKLSIAVSMSSRDELRGCSKVVSIKPAKAQGKP